MTIVSNTVYLKIANRSVLSVHWKDYVKAETPILWPPDAKS